jgi:hypothetical protein
MKTTNAKCPRCYHMALTEKDGHYDCAQCCWSGREPIFRLDADNVTDVHAPAKD